ncbi:hypothetical protein [Actinospongicola halichondriae]|uniref:hypothetical protein n=1 Tax=Actinospongicola halichondriae TaxID=3236844 RepID=UPI003D4EF432
MLTLILLVVLGGVVGIMAVSMAERKPATNGGPSRRAGGAKKTASPAPAPQVHHEPEPESTRTIAVGSPASPPPHTGTVPASQTAVEGRFADLVRPSLPRRVTSLVGLAVIVVVVGVGIAAIIGAVVGGAAEILGNAIG